MRGVFIGRFQPPHWGHVKAIQHILGEVDELIIVVGSAQFNYSEKDPFTAGERILMLREAMKEVNIDLGRLIMIPLNNTENNHSWVKYLESYIPPFDVAYTGNQFVAMLLRGAGYRVVQQPLFSREIYVSTLIREKILKGDETWRNLVPASVAKILDELDASNRLRVIASGEAEPQKW
ncbi:MAG: nicotinamide-nucleotide adenylyltransferase [Thermocladium sp.]|jgi:nicotinamide-nucleotide adenylyltransferase|nr:MAG: nicotinamide-nucleotide adenylyltransferase [Thermocladium sp. ECH_B]